ncbi:sigma-E factor regulatory protein RseB domain-containing protein [Citrobacter enshiensis]|uniref:sigma-E factor regulatory protein RseB domain-containing protein n=1 Tax=Citrobacter enshiensis TaxID=2971264 RepID=UPI00399D721B
MCATLLFFSGMTHPAENVAVASAFSQNVKTTNLIDLSQQQFEHIQSYQVLLRSSSPQDESKVIRYSYRKPGFVRMDFTRPHPGAVLTYNPVSRKVKLWPFGLGTFPVLNLSPTDSLIQDDHGHRVDQSDIGVLLSNIRRLQHDGTTVTVGEETLAGRATLHLSVTGPKGVSVDDVNRYEIWLDKSHGLPAKVVSYDRQGKLLETVLMDAMVINIQFPADFFTP